MSRGFVPVRRAPFDAHFYAGVVPSCPMMRFARINGGGTAPTRDVEAIDAAEVHR